MESSLRGGLSPQNLHQAYQKDIEILSSMADVDRAAELSDALKEFGKGNPRNEELIELAFSHLKFVSQLPERVRQTIKSW